MIFHCILFISGNKPPYILMRKDKVKYVFLLSHICEIITTKLVKIITEN